MKIHSKRFIIGIVVITTAGVLLLRHFYGPERAGSGSALKEKVTGIREISNYIFTKLGSRQGLIRVYGINNSPQSIGEFPVVISYLSKEGKKIGADTCDLLAQRKALNPHGEFTAELAVTYPEGTQTVALDVITE